MTLVLKATSSLTAPKAQLPEILSDLLVDVTFDYLTATIPDGGTVQSVTSQGGSTALTIAGANGTLSKPTLQHGGRAALVFDGRMGVKAASTSAIIFDGEPMTIVAVANISSAEPSGEVVGVSNTNGGYRDLAFDSSGSVVGGSTAATGVAAGVPHAVDRWAVYSAAWSTGGGLVTRRSPSARATGKTAMSVFRGMSLMSNLSGTQTVTGKLRRVMLFRRALSDGDSKALFDHLAGAGYLAG